MESSFLLSKQANPHRFQQEAQKQNLTLPGRCCWQSTSLKAALLERNVQFLFLLGVLAVLSSAFLSFPIEVSEQQAKPPLLSGSPHPTPISFSYGQPKVGQGPSLSHLVISSFRAAGSVG